MKNHRGMHRLVSCAAGAAVVAAAAWCRTAKGDVVTTEEKMPWDSTVNDFSMFEGTFFQSNGPVDLGDGVTWTAAYEGWMGDMAFGLRENGYWDWDRVGYSALNASNSWMLFRFEKPVSAVGGFVNYAPLQGSGPMPTIEAIGIHGEVLERFTMDVRTPGGVNEGQFMGFVRRKADIAALRYAARFGVLDNLTYRYGTAWPPGIRLSVR